MSTPRLFQPLDDYLAGAQRTNQALGSRPGACFSRSAPTWRRAGARYDRLIVTGGPAEPVGQSDQRTTP